MVDIRDTSMKQKKVWKAGSILALKRCESYNNSLSSVNLNLVWVGFPPVVPIYYFEIVSTYLYIPR